MLMITLAIVGVGPFIGDAILRAPTLAVERKELARREADNAAEQLSIANRVAKYAQEHPADKQAQEDAETEMLRAISARAVVDHGGKEDVRLGRDLGERDA